MKLTEKCCVERESDVGVTESVKNERLNKRVSLLEKVTVFLLIILIVLSIEIFFIK